MSKLQKKIVQKKQYPAGTSQSFIHAQRLLQREINNAPEYLRKTYAHCG
jgi:hypothetical protein